MGMGIECNPCCGNFVDVSSASVSSNTPPLCACCIATNNKWKITLDNDSYQFFYNTCMQDFYIGEFVLFPTTNITTEEIIPCQWSSAENVKLRRQSGFTQICDDTAAQIPRFSLVMNGTCGSPGLDVSAYLYAYMRYKPSPTQPEQTIQIARWGGIGGAPGTISCLLGGTLTYTAINPITGITKTYVATLGPNV